MTNPKLRNLGYLMRNAVPPAREWVGHSFLRKQSVAVVGSWAKAGKSFVCAQIAKDLVFGGRVFNHPALEVYGTPRVLMLEQEVGEDGSHERMQHVFLGSNWESAEDRFWIISREPKFKVDTLMGLQAIRQEIYEVQPNILILDPAGKLMEGDDSSNQDVGKFFDHLAILIEEFKSLDLSIIVVQHCGKPPKDVKDKKDLLSPYSLRGASKWFDAPDTILMMHRDDERGIRPGWLNHCKVTLRHGEDLPLFDLAVNHYRAGAQYFEAGRERGRSLF